MRGLIRRAFVTIGAAGVLAAGMVAAGAGATGPAAAATVTGTEAALPANAASNPFATLPSVSCASAGNCTAVGSYNDNSGNSSQGLLLTQTAGTWATGTEAALPKNAESTQAILLNSVSCASAGNCTAVGRYTAISGNNLKSVTGQGLLLTQTGGTWATGTKAPLPANAGSNPNVKLLSVSCASVGNCTAVGTYRDSSGNTQGLLLTQTGGTWAAGTDAPLPANAGSSPAVILRSVSCASAGNCTAVGSYTDSSRNTQGLLVTQSSPT